MSVANVGSGSMALFVVVYLLIGYITYRAKYPAGFCPDETDEERARLLRLGRRRVLPLPEPGDEP